MKSNVIYNWLLINIPLFAIIIMGFITNTLQPIFNDVTYITHFIFGCILFTIFYTFYIAVNLNSLVSTDTVKNLYTASKVKNKKEILYANLERKLNFPKFMMGFIVTLGFLGTIIGVSIGFRHLPENAFNDPTKMQEFVRMMLVGFSTELNSLIMSVMGRIWVSIIVYSQAKQLQRIFLETISKE